MVGDWIDDLVDEGVDEATSRSSVRSVTGWLTDAINWLVPGSRTPTSPTAPAVTTPNPIPGLMLIGGAALILYWGGAFSANPRRITNRNRRRR